jgi:hypothetical protein
LEKIGAVKHVPRLAWQIPSLYCTDSRVLLQHISTKGSKSSNMKPDAKQFVFHNSPNEAAHIIGPGKTITSKVPSFCVYYSDAKRSFSKSQAAGFLPWTGVCQT